MAIGGEAPPRGAADPARWLTRPPAAAGADLPLALDEVASRVHEVLPVDLVVVRLIDETGGDECGHGYCLGPSAQAQALGPLLGRDCLEPTGLADAAVAAGTTVTWPRLVAEPAAVARLAELADGGGAAGALHRVLVDASGVGVPLATPDQPSLGAIALVSLSREQPVPASAAAELAALTPQIALAVRNHQLTARSRRNRQTLEGVIAGSRMGMIVTDLRGRLSLANRAAADILGIPLDPLIGRPMRTAVSERIKWRFTNPDDYAAWLLEAHADPSGEAVHEAETVDGRAVEHSSAPVRDAAGAIVGRVDILTDVTAAREALAQARRLAAERAELLQREERRAQEEVTLSRAAHLMASALTPAEIHDILLDQAHALVPGCEMSAVLTADARGVVLPAVTRGFDPATTAKMTFRSGEGTVGRMMVDRRPFICNDTEVDDRLSTRITGPEGIRSFMLVPLVHGERVLGLVSLNCLSPREFGEREVRLVTELARHAAGALANALQFERERHIAETLQTALLAHDLPRVPGVELAALYQPAAGSLVGGDFYSAWTLPDGRLALLVGDVSGKGVEAAGVTAMVRYMAEALSRHRPGAGVLLTELNDLLCRRLPGDSLVTVVLAVIDTASGELRWSSAGHPPPVVLGARGGYRTLDDPDPPCGAFPGHAFHEGVERLGQGDALVLYTDGVLEARRQGRELGEAGLRGALLATPGAAPADLAAAVHTAARDWCGGRLSDDVAIAVVRRTGPETGPAPAAAAG